MCQREERKKIIMYLFKHIGCNIDTFTFSSRTFFPFDQLNGPLNVLNATSCRLTLPEWKSFRKRKHTSSIAQISMSSELVRKYTKPNCQFENCWGWGDKNHAKRKDKQFHENVIKFNWDRNIAGGYVVRIQLLCLTTLQIQMAATHTHTYTCRRRAYAREKKKFYKPWLINRLIDSRNFLSQFSRLFDKFQSISRNQRKTE